ncbi:von Willebrand factor D and EGF domain-containing protein-like [Saccoglossus kowalevskii]
MNSTTGQQCISVLDDKDIDDTIDGCVTDVQVLDDLIQGSASALSSIQSQCIEVASRNTTFWDAAESNNSTNATFAQPATVIEVLCPGDCNGRGVCLLGQCNCTLGYAGSDCAIDLNQAPEVWFPYESGLCNTEDGCPSNVPIYGNNFVESDDLTCHVLPVKLTEEGFTIPENTSEAHAGTFQNYGEVECPHPGTLREKRDINGTGSSKPADPVGGLFSVSNDGVRESVQVLVISYNGNCDVCNSTEGSCYRKTDICIFNGDCYHEDSDECQTDVYQVDNTGVIIGAVVGCVVAIAVIATVAILYKKKSAITRVHSLKDLKTSEETSATLTKVRSLSGEQSTLGIGTTTTDENTGALLTPIEAYEMSLI